MAVAGSTLRVNRLCDPFGGSGTSALAAQFLGIESVSIEVNPYLADLVRAKVSTYNIKKLSSALLRVEKRARLSKKRGLGNIAVLPGTFVQPGRNQRWLFDRAVAIEVEKLKHAIGREKARSIRRLFRVLLGGSLVEFSNAVISGKGRRYRRDWQRRRMNPSDVVKQFSSAAGNAIAEINALSERSKARSIVICGDSRKRLRSVGAVDLIVCSPPYPNSFDYTDVYNMELWMLGYLKSPKQNRKLRRSTLSSHVQIAPEFSMPPDVPTLRKLLERMTYARKMLWNENLIAMVGGYFRDLEVVLDGCRKILRANGQAWFVVGDSQYAGIQIKVADILCEIAESVGLSIVRRQPFRSMRLSPQQGGKRRLAESLVVFTKS